MNVSARAQALWRQFEETGDRSARDQLVVHYSPLVKYVAGRVRARLPVGADQDDLISDGVVGLMGAIEHFDVGRGLQFQTYAQPRIRGAIIDGLRASDWVPRLVREQVRDRNAATATLEHRLRRHPDESEVAAELGISVRELSARSSRSAYATLSNAEFDQFDHHVTNRATEGIPGAAHGLSAGLLGALHDLPERDQIVLALYYWERLSLAEIAQVLDLSESRISQLMRRATVELRRFDA